jgi:Fatty acid desaturase
VRGPTAPISVYLFACLAVWPCRDPNGAVIGFADMMRKQIVMPAHMMDDGEHHASTGRNLFADFSTVAEATGTYTAQDYADIMEHLIQRWKLGSLEGEGPNGRGFGCGSRRRGGGRGCVAVVLAGWPAGWLSLPLTGDQSCLRRLCCSHSSVSVHEF